MRRLHYTGIISILRNIIPQISFLKTTDYSGSSKLSKENENEIPEFDRDLVPDPVLSFLRTVSAWPDNSRHHPRPARTGRCHFYIAWPLRTPPFGIQPPVERLYLFNGVVPAFERKIWNIPSQYCPRSPARRTEQRAPIPIPGCAHARNLCERDSIFIHHSQ